LKDEGLVHEEIASSESEGEEEEGVEEAAEAAE
jgi:hypothetical protein